MKKKMPQSASPVVENDKDSTSADSDKEADTGENRCRINEYRTELNNLWNEMVQIKQTMDSKWEMQSKGVEKSKETLTSPIKETKIKNNVIINKKPKELSKEKPVFNNKNKMPVAGNQKSDTLLTADAKNKKKVVKTVKLVAKNNKKDISKKGL